MGYNVSWCWCDAEQQDFLALKAAMATVPVMHFPALEQQFVVTTDASDVAIGAILKHNFASGRQIRSGNFIRLKYAIRCMKRSYFA